MSHPPQHQFIIHFTPLYLIKLLISTPQSPSHNLDFCIFIVCIPNVFIIGFVLAHSIVFVLLEFLLIVYETHT